MIDAVVSAFKIPDLRRKMLFTLGILVLFRIIASVPVPGVNREGLSDFIEGNQLLGTRHRQRAKEFRKRHLHRASEPNVEEV